MEKDRLNRGKLMAKHLADSTSEIFLQNYLERYPELNHVHVRRRGDLLILESGPREDPFPHARFRRNTAHLWDLEMPSNGGKRWEQTPIRAPLNELAETVITRFAWMLMSPYENPVRT